MEALKAGLTFPLDPFMESYLYSFSLTSVQLTLNLWAYLLGFTKYVRLVLKAEPTIPLSRYMFTMYTKESFDGTYVISGMDRDVKRKFKGSLSKVQD